VKYHILQSKSPFFSVGDEAFPLKPNFMRPYRKKDLDYPKRIFNYQITRARRTVECSFGMLTKKFGVLQTSIETRVEIAEEVVKSACVLHIFMQKEKTFNYFHGGGDASDFRCSNTGLTCTRSTRSTREATSVRNALKDLLSVPSWRY
jgi:hypothetical protein